MITAAVPQSSLKDPSLTTIDATYLSAWSMYVSAPGLEVKFGL